MVAKTVRSAGGLAIGPWAPIGIQSIVWWSVVVVWETGKVALSLKASLAYWLRGAAAGDAETWRTNVDKREARNSFLEGIGDIVSRLKWCWLTGEGIIYSCVDDEFL